jgi:hypothetical protein
MLRVIPESRVGTTSPRPNCAASSENRRGTLTRKASESRDSRLGSRTHRTAGTARSAFHQTRAKARDNNGWNERDRERNAVTGDGRGAGRLGHPTRIARFERMETSEGNKAQEGDAYGHLHKVAEGTDSSAEQGLEGPGPIGTTGGDGAGNGDGIERRGPMTTKSPRRQRSQRCDTAAEQGTPSKGERRDARRPPGGDQQGAIQRWMAFGAGSTERRAETYRTPGSAAGCNKPANLVAEQTGEVV